MNIKLTLLAILLILTAFGSTNADDKIAPKYNYDDSGYSDYGYDSYHDYATVEKIKIFKFEDIQAGETTINKWLKDGTEQKIILQRDVKEVDKSIVIIYHYTVFIAVKPWSVPFLWK